MDRSGEDALDMSRMRRLEVEEQDTFRAYEQAAHDQREALWVLWKKAEGRLEEAITDAEEDRRIARECDLM